MAPCVHGLSDPDFEIEHIFPTLRCFAVLAITGGRDEESIADDF